MLRQSNRVLRFREDQEQIKSIARDLLNDPAGVKLKDGKVINYDMYVTQYVFEAPEYGEVMRRIDMGGTDGLRACNELRGMCKKARLQCAFDHFDHLLDGHYIKHITEQTKAALCEVFHDSLILTLTAFLE